MTHEAGGAESGIDAVKSVRADEVIKKGLDEQSSGREKAEAVIPPLQKVGYKLAVFLFLYISAASIVIFFVSFRCVQLPAFPQPPASGGNAQEYKDAAEAYKQSSDVYMAVAKLQVDRALQLFQLIVASTILPAFTAILGYIFGSRKND